MTKPSSQGIADCCFVFYTLQSEIKAAYLFQNFSLADEETSTLSSASTIKETNPISISCFDPQQLHQSTDISFIA